MSVFHTGLFTFRNGGMLLAKTNYTAVAVYDGDMDATDLDFLAQLRGLY